MSRLEVRSEASRALRQMVVAEARKRPGRVVVTVLMIALGAGALSTALILGDSVRTAVNDGLVVEYAGIDIVDNAGTTASQTSVGGADSTQVISARDIKEIAALPQVEATGSLYRTLALAQVGDVTRGIPLESLNTNPAFQWQGWSDGRPPTGPNEVALTAYTLDELGIRLGDNVALGRPEFGTALYRVVGVVDTRGSLDKQRGVYGIVPTATAKALSGLTAPNQVLITAVDGTDIDKLVNEINRVAPTGLPQTTRDILSADRGVALQQINAMDAVVSGLAAVSCLVAAITSATTAGASLATRRRNWALLRCVGASGRQVGLLVASESVLAGLAGGVVGVALGVGTSRLALPLIGLIPGLPELHAATWTVEPRSLLLPVLVALVLSAAGSVVPAWLAARIPPSAALKTTSTPGAAPSPLRAGASTVALVAGLVVAFRGSGDGQAWPVVGGVLLALVAFVVLIPSVLVAGARFLAARSGSASIRLGLADVVRRPRAATIEAVAVVLAVAMIALTWVALSSVQETTAARISQSDQPDLVVGSVSGASVSTSTVEQIAAVEGVDRAVPITYGAGVSIVGRGADGPVTLTTGTATADLEDMDAALPKGSPVTTLRTDTVYLPRTEFPPFFEGRPVRVVGPKGRVKGMNVAYVEGLQVPTLVAPDVLARVAEDRSVREVWVALGETQNRAQVVDELAGIAIRGGGLPVAGPTILDVKTAEAFSTARAAAVAILGIAVLVAVVGAAATAALSIAERSREHATLRALGLERANLGRMLATRVLFVATSASLLGVALGTVLGLVSARLVANALTLEPETSLPLLPVLAVVVVTVAAVRAAALFPVERASYIPPSRALARS